MSSTITPAERMENTSHLIDFAEESICQAITQIEQLQRQLPKNKANLRKLRATLLRSQIQLSGLSGVFLDGQQDPEQYQ